MKPNEATLLLPAAAWSDPRVHLLDDTWLLTIFAILIATAVPWLASSFDVGFAAAAAGLLILGAIHLAFTALINPARASSRARTRMLTALHAIGILVIGFIWHYAGGLQNPAFLMVFALPVIGAIFLSRGQPYFMAVLAILVVAAVALAQAPELRWYVTGLNAAGGWLAAVFGADGATLATPFPGFYAPSSYFIVMLEVFAILSLACAVAAEHLATVFDRLYANVSAARAEAERGQELWATLIEHLPLPALLVDANTLQVICASETVAAHFGRAGQPSTGRKLFETVQFTYPEVIQELIAGVGGIAKLNMVRVAGRLRAAEVRVEHVAQRGRRFALVIIADRTEELATKAALDVSGHAALVVDTEGRVLAFNKPALGLFAGTEIGADASKLLGQTDSAARWWEPSFTGRRKMHVEILQRIYQVTSTAVALPGEEERIYIIAFLPVARTAISDEAAAGATVVIPALTQTTPVHSP